MQTGFVRLMRRVLVLAVAGGWAVGLAGCSDGTANLEQIAYSGDPVSDFVTALNAGDAATVERLVDGDPSLLALQDELGQTPMHYAALAGQVAVIRTLHGKGLDINARDAEGRTPLTVLEDSGFRFEGARSTIIKLGGKN